MVRTKRKVAHLTSVHPASDTRIAFRECASLAEAGYDVVLIAANGEVGDVPAGVRLRRVPPSNGRLERMTKTIWNVYRAALEERADIYHFHDPELMGVGLALRMHGAHVVFDVHEHIPQDIHDKHWVPRPLRVPLSWIAYATLRAMYHCYSAVVTATPSIARVFPKRRTVVIANYPRVEELWEDSAVSEKFADRPRAAAYLGAITELRGISDMLAAYQSPEMTEGTRLLLAGQFESPELLRKAESSPVWKNVDYVGFCKREDVARLFARVRVGLLMLQPAANFEESLPTKLFEYMGAGLPVVVNGSMRCSDLVRQYDCGIVVKPGDVDAAARAISFLIDNPGVAQAMGERGRRLVMENYQWKTEASKLTQLYAEIA